MPSITKLENAKLILEKELTILLKILKFEPKLARIHIILRDNVQVLFVIIIMMNIVILLFFLKWN